MNHNYAQRKLECLLRDLNSYTADEFRREMARIISGSTNQHVDDDCHLLTEENKRLKEIIDAGWPASVRLKPNLKGKHHD